MAILKKHKIPQKSKHSRYEQEGADYIAKLFGGTSGKINNDNVDRISDDFSPEALIDSENEFDLVKIVSKSLDPHTGVPRNIKIPEGDFKEAKNFFDFCLNFRGPDAKFPFSRQMWLMLMLFGEICPKCTDKKLFNIMNVPVGLDPKNIPNKIRLMNYGVCPRCKGQKSDFLKRSEINEYVEMSLCVGQRAGKSTTSAAGTEYLTHKYLMYPKMSSVCRGVSSATPLVATFVGYRFADAFSLLWDPVIKGIKDSVWFCDYHAMLDHYGSLHGIEFYRMKDIYLRYGHKSIELYPSGPTKRGLRGRTRWLSIIDEIGWFPIEVEGKEGDRERADANGTYDALDRSLLTLREEVTYLTSQGHNRFLQAYAINISSPSSQADKITRLVEENKDSDSNLALRLPTWEINPLLPRTSKRIVNAYRKNPVEAERDYGANPPLNSASFIVQHEAERAFIGKNRVSISHVQKKIDERWRQGGKVETSSPLQPMPATLMSLDAGLTNNSFSATVLHLDVQTVDGIKTTTVHCPVIIEIMPKRGHMLHYPMIYKNVLKPIMKEFNTRFLFADRWNSISLLDTAAEEFVGVNLVAKQYSVKYQDFVTTRSYIEEGKLILPKIEMESDLIRRVDEYPYYFLGKPAAHLLFQLITVKDMGKVVLKGDGYTDDNFRALVLGVSRILDDKINAEMIRLGSILTKNRVTGAISVGRSGNIPGIRPQNNVSYGASNSSSSILQLNGSGVSTTVHHGNSHVVRIARS